MGPVRSSALAITPADTPQRLDAVRQLFREYAAWLGPIACFTTLENEVAALPGDYRPPAGVLLLAEEAGESVGCVGLRRLEDDIGEIKRLYVRPQYRGRQAGRRLMEAALAEARRIGYRRLRLDTVEAAMQSAVGLYRALGFVPIPPYMDDPLPGAMCMELRL